MKVTFLGTGTSQGVPIIACDCKVCVSDQKRDKRLRTSVLIEVADKTIVIDSGPDFRYQMLRAKVKDLDAVLFTHEHKDHIAGLDDVRPFNYLLHKVIDVYATDRVQLALRREFHYVFSDTKYFGLPKINLHPIVNGVSFKIGEVEVKPIEVLHHQLPVTGFRIGDFTYITDAKTISDSSLELIKGTKVLVLNALQKNAHISHFTLDEALEFAQKVNAEYTYLTHISHNLGLYDQVSAELPFGVYLAYDGLEIEL